MDDDLQALFEAYKAEFQKEFPGVHPESYLINFLQGELIDRLKEFSRLRTTQLKPAQILALQKIAGDSLEREERERKPGIIQEVQ